MTATIVLVLRVGLALVLFVFLWRVYQTLWQDLKQQGNHLSQRKTPGIRLSTIMDDGGNNEYRFWQAEISIGRGLQNDISLSDESMSAVHARLSFHHNQWWVEDMGSRNGTFLDKHLVSVPTVITTGDEFKCGNTLFRIHVDKSEGKFFQPTKSYGDEQ